MARYRADVWLGSNSGFQTVEINSSSINGVAEQIKSIYQVKPENIRNIRKVNAKDNSDSESFVGFGILVLFVIFALYPIIVLTILSGAGGAWMSTKLSGKSFSLICTKGNKKIYNTVLIVSLLCGGLGFYIGNNIEIQQKARPK
jgi:hypothetical protein